MHHQLDAVDVSAAATLREFHSRIRVPAASAELFEEWFQLIRVRANQRREPSRRPAVDRCLQC